MVGDHMRLQYSWSEETNYSAIDSACGGEPSTA